ncbi:MAG: hypothetical protein KatS3mg130_0179 [Candidatus Sumerlaea sp.]|nr:DUF2225 domain-containing protein [Candidatus Sumerlaea chitinivorans]GIX43771.1 MAG: hypothetical protein KatS3mg130_0179 [Candidatus Sumerlaea sp.]
MHKRWTLFVAVGAAVLMLSGCAQRGPEERLEKVAQLYQKRDLLGARLEAKELVQKYPESKEALTARFVLAQVYLQDRQPDEALAELEQVLARTTQKDQMGIQALAMTLDILKRSQRFEEAYKLIDKYQKEYANDAITSLQLTVARADTMAEAGETTRARELLVSLMEQSTSPMERRQFRSLIGETFMRERAALEAARFFESMFESASTDDDKRDIALRAAWFYAAADDYQSSRKWAERATELFAKAIEQELDAAEKSSLAHSLGYLYMQIGNLRGAEEVLRAVFNSPATTMEELPRLVNELVMVFLRQGKADDAIAFLKEAAERYPQSPLAQDAARLESFKAQGKLDTVDTSPLVMKWSADPLLSLDPALLPKADAATSGPAARSAEQPQASNEGITQEPAQEGAKAATEAAPGKADETTTKSD